MRKTWYAACLLTVLAASATALPASAQQKCDAASFASLIDETAQILRTLNKDSEERFQTRLRAAAKTKGWSESEAATKAMAAMDERQVAPFNDEIEQLVSQLDRLSVTPKGEMSCDRLRELKSVRDRLVGVMGRKSGFVLAQIDVLSKDPAPVDSASKEPAAKKSTAISLAPTPPAEPAPVTPPASKADIQPSKPPSNNVAEQKPGQDWRPPSWQANPSKLPVPDSAKVTSGKSASLAPLPLRPPETPAAAAVPSVPDLPPAGAAPSGGYSLQEIRDASQGVFGAISSELAGVINYAFRRYGQPNGYIIGNEGGGAFLAGLRYGDGELRTRIDGAENGPTKIYWQGPSVGIDIGANGSRTIFLVYNLDDPGRLYERFPGIDGSAYVAGGVGLTVYKTGKTLIVPIRTGLGLRIGASLAYLKFTERASWNPF